MNSIHDHNRQAWDRLVRRNQRHTRPAEEKDLRDPLSVIDARGWLGGDIRGRRVLCLAAGGGRQSALYAEAGAEVTVLDLSPEMLARDREMADAKGYAIKIVEGSMDDLSMLADAVFDIVIHPVSTCYVPDVRPVYREVARVIVDGGLYISQHKQPGSMQGGTKSLGGGYLLEESYYRTGPLPPVEDSRHREPGTLEFLHRWEELLGFLCRAGFAIEDLAEPYHGGDQPPAPDTFAHRCRWLPPYVRIKARRLPRAVVPAVPPSQAKKLWMP